MEKILITLMFAAFSAHVQCADDEYPFVASGCQEKYGLTLEEVLEFRADTDLALDNRKLKCYAACLFQYLGLMVIDAMVYARNTTSENRKDILLLYDHCSEGCPIDDPCKFAFHLIKCIEKLNLDISVNPFKIES